MHKQRASVLAHELCECVSALTPPGVKHWHGATATTAMRHIAITGMAGGKNVEWPEKVQDEQYNAK
jgi:quercetin dioxygenase-like cupin family protein